MSFYFSQLLAASGVRVTEKLAPAPPQPAALPESPEIVEIGGAAPVETLSTAFPPRTIESQSVEHVIAEPSPISETASIPLLSPEPQAPAPLRVSAVEAAHIEMLSPPTAQIETLSPPTAQQRPSHEAVTPAPVPPHGASHAPGPLPQPPEGRGQPPQVTAEEILGAVMNWIAAGKTLPRDAGSLSPSPPSASVGQDPPVSPPPQTPPVVEQSVPERSIMEVQAVAVPAPVPAAETGPASPASGPGAARMPGNASPSITIGAIHLRVEAPPAPSPAPRPVVPARPKAPRSPSASWLKLRRHYVLPH